MTANHHPDHPPGPLAGIKVLDLTQIMAGPMCTLLLADLGADVIKIERPGSGDDTRRMGSRIAADFAAGFLALNRNKRSIALDLRAADGKAVFRRLAQTADIVAENFRPGVMERLGLGYETLSQINPRLVYASISGFGGSGPYRHRGGFDLVAQGMSGLMSVTGFPDGPPAKVGVPITDIGAGAFTAFGILAAYIHARRTGQGQQVDASLLEAGIATPSGNPPNTSPAAPSPAPSARRTASTPPTRPSAPPTATSTSAPPPSPPGSSSAAPSDRKPSSTTPATGNPTTAKPAKPSWPRCWRTSSPAGLPPTGWNAWTPPAWLPAPSTIWRRSMRTNRPRRGKCW